MENTISVLQGIPLYKNHENLIRCVSLCYKYGNQNQSQINYLIIEIIRHYYGTKFVKKLKLENFQFFLHSRCLKCHPKANNNCEAVVVCARYVVNRPSKRSVLVYIINSC